MFLHGGWGHLLGNLLFFWVFGNNIEDSMGRGPLPGVLHPLRTDRGAGAHVRRWIRGRRCRRSVRRARSPGVLGAYLILYPNVRVRMLFWFLLFIRMIPHAGLGGAAVVVLLAGRRRLPQLMTLDRRGFRRRGGLGAHRRVRRRAWCW